MAVHEKTIGKWLGQALSLNDLILEAQDMSSSYNGAVVLDQLDLQIDPGEIFAS